MSHPLYLIELNGQHSFLLAGKDELLLGRDPALVLCINDETLDLHHAALSWQAARDTESEGSWWIEDLDSVEGTFRQGKSLSPGHKQRLDDGMRVRFGLREFVCSTRAPLKVATPPDEDERADDAAHSLPDLRLLEQLHAMLQGDVPSLLKGFLDLLEAQLTPARVILSLEEELLMRGPDTPDATAAVVMHQARFQTHPLAFASAPDSDALGEGGADTRLEALVAPLMLGTLVSGYVYVLCHREQAWSRGEFRLFGMLAKFVSHGLTMSRQLQRAKEDREVLQLHLVGTAPPMARLKSTLLQRAQQDTPVLVCGDEGVGKSRIARAVHQASARREAPLLVLNAAQFPKELFESALCGSVQVLPDGASVVRKGKLALAEGGSLLIEEIDALPLGVQPLLVALLESGHYSAAGDQGARKANVRMLFTSSIPLSALREREDWLPQLVHQLEGHQLWVPSLSERSEDIPILFRSFLGRLGEDEGLPTCVVSAQALQPLMQHEWRANIRELREIVARCFYELDPTHPVVDERLILQVLEEHNTEQTEPPRDHLGKEVRALERRLIQEALMAANDDIAEAAKALGISRVVLRHKMRTLAMG